MLINNYNSHAVCSNMSVANTMRVMARKPLTPEQIEDARRLRRLYDEAKTVWKFSQADAAFAMGYAGQSAVSQYVNGSIPLNLDALLKFSKFLKASPEEISPSLAEMLAQTQPGAYPKADFVFEKTGDDGRKALVVAEVKSAGYSAIPDELKPIETKLLKAWASQSLSKAAIKAIGALIDSFPAGSATPQKMGGTPEANAAESERDARLLKRVKPPKPQSDSNKDDDISHH